MSLVLNPICLGKFGKTFGVKGYISIISYSDNYEWLEYGNLFYQEKDVYKSLVFLDLVSHSSKVRGLIEGFDVVEKSQSLVNRQIVISRDDMPETKDEFYHVDLIGLRVNNESGALVGTVVSIINNNSQDVFVIDGDDNFVPYIDVAVLKIDLEEGTMVVASDFCIKRKIMLQIDVITLFPQMFDVLRYGVTNRAFCRWQCAIKYTLFT